jgi:hypothetical protein
MMSGQVLCEASSEQTCRSRAIDVDSRLITKDTPTIVSVQEYGDV